MRHTTYFIAKSLAAFPLNTEEIEEIHVHLIVKYHISHINRKIR
jgi:hypothetical protein